MQGELAQKDKELVASGVEIEKLLHKIGENTAVAEKEKAKVAVIVSQVTVKAQVPLWLFCLDHAFSFWIFDFCTCKWASKVFYKIEDLDWGGHIL